MSKVRELYNSIRANPIIKGFASIRHHETEGMDEHLKLSKPKPEKPIIGFATIHPMDNTGQAVEESTQPIDKYHLRYMHHSDEDAEHEHFRHHEALNSEYVGLRAKYRKNKFTHGFPGHAIRRYTGVSKHINAKLIKYGTKHNPNTHEGKDIAEIGRETSEPRNAVQHHTILHSGLSAHFGEHLAKKKLGTKVHFPAFTSTSTSRKTATAFGEMRSVGDDKIHVAHFHLSPGFHHARFVKSISQTEHEKEAIIHHGTTWKKVGHHEETGRIEQMRGGAIYHKPDIIHHHFIPA